MKNEWKTVTVPFKYMLSDLTLYKQDLVLKVQSFSIDPESCQASAIELPNIKLATKEQGYILRSIPLHSEQPIYKVVEDHIYYIPDQFNRYYIELQQSFNEYTAKFSSKTRSTIRRKIRKFSKKCNGDMHWKKYQTDVEIIEFYRNAREVSKNSYQEKLLDSGLPDTKEFRDAMTDLAKKGLVRGYLLFDGVKPVAYMYCPINNRILLYQYLGFDPKYIKWSVGTILHWFSFEDIFAEGTFKYFDFTEGQSDHKRLYSTGSILCGNIYIFPNKIRNKLFIKAHYACNSLSNLLGDFFERFGLKSKIKRFIRFKNER